MLTEPPHVLTKPPHVLTKPPHALTKPPHTLTKPVRAVTKRMRVLPIPPALQTWLPTGSPPETDRIPAHLRALETLARHSRSDVSMP